MGVGGFLNVSSSETGIVARPFFLAWLVMSTTEGALRAARAAVVTVAKPRPAAADLTKDSSAGRLAFSLRVSNSAVGKAAKPNVPTLERSSSLVGSR